MRARAAAGDGIDAAAPTWLATAAASRWAAAVGVDPLGICGAAQPPVAPLRVAGGEVVPDELEEAGEDPAVVWLVVVPVDAAVWSRAGAIV